MTTAVVTTSIPDWRKPALFGYIIIIATFVVGGGWAAFAKLDSAVTAPGIVAVESNRKTVQHLEGGIVRDIFVQEGQRVVEGQPLFKLDAVAPRASYDLQRNQLDFLLAQEARLIAERDGKLQIEFPAEMQGPGHDPANVRAAMTDQTNQFNERRGSLSGQTDILQSKIEQYRTEIRGLTEERTATQGQLSYINEELADVRYLLDKNLVQKSRVLALEREKSRLEGVIGRSTADQAKAENNIGEADLQIRQLRQKFSEDVAGAIQDVRQKIADSREKVRVASDVLNRLDIKSPATGVVQNLHVFTAGGVIKAGEPLLDVVPEHAPLIVQARVSPNDIDSVRQDMQAEIRLSAFHSRLIPIMLGKVMSVSRDRLVDEQSKQPYFLAQVLVDEVPDELRQRLTAGMPADVVFPTGERTVISYLVNPLRERMRTVMREH
jgi:HlyD family type I secretion membrane fusion protein